METIPNQHDSNASNDGKARFDLAERFALDNLGLQAEVPPGTYYEFRF